jgi:probable O-glycosylation ligase (exosortase A-associated)
LWSRRTLFALPRVSTDQHPGQITAAGAKRFLVYLAAMVASGAVGFSLTHYPIPLVAGLLLALVGGVTIILYPFAGLLLYTIVFILRPGETYPILSVLHIERVIGAFTLASMFLAKIREEGDLALDSTMQTRWFLVFLVTMVLSIPMSYWLSHSISSFVDMLKIGAFYLMVVHLVDSRPRLKVFFWVYLALIVYMDLVALHGYYTGSAAFAQGIDRATGNTSAAGNANKLGTTLACTIPFFVLLTVQARRFWHRILAGAGTLLLLWGMVITGSRASMLGFLAAMTYFWWISGRRILLGTLGILALVGGFLAMPAQYQERYATVTKSTLDESSSARVATWLTGLEMIADRPLFGVGAGCFGAARGEAYSAGGRRSYLESHSLYIQVVTELGIVGAIAFFGFVFQFLRLNRRAADLVKGRGSSWGFESLLLTALFAGFLVLLLSGIFGHSLYRRTWYVYAALGLAIYRIHFHHPPEPAPDPAGPGPRSLASPNKHQS